MSNEVPTGPDVGKIAEQSLKFGEKALKLIADFLRSSDIDSTLKTYIVLGVVAIIVIVFVFIYCLVLAGIDAFREPATPSHLCFVFMIVPFLLLMALGVPVLRRSGSTEQILRTKTNFQMIAEARTGTT